MRRTLSERLSGVRKSLPSAAPEGLPLTIAEALCDYDPKADQLEGFRQWELLEIQELAIRFAKVGRSVLDDESAVEESDKPDSAPSSQSNSEAHESEDPESTEAEDPDSDPEHEAPVEVPHDEDLEEVIAWLKTVCGDEAQQSVHSAAFPVWALEVRNKRGVTRWQAHQRLARLREATTDDLPEARELAVQQAAIEEGVLAQNMRAAVKWAYCYRGDLPVALALGASLVGLRRAARAFEASRGNKFLTLGAWWMHQNVNRARQDYGLGIRIPVHRAERQAALRTALGGMTLKETRGQTANSVEALIHASHRQDWTNRESQQALDFDRNQWRNDVDDPTAQVPLADLLFDETKYSPRQIPPFLEATGDLTEEVDEIRSLIFKYFGGEKNERTREIVTRRLGLDGARRPMTLETLGAKYDVTRERIRQIEAKAFDQIRLALERGGNNE